MLTVAGRVAQEFGCNVGEEVGYGIRFDFKCSDRTKIRYYTDGVLLRETMNDPLLSKYSVIIVDEAHQRSLQSDILLGLLKKIQKRRTDLRIIVTSATLDATALKSFFENNMTDDPTQDDTLIMSVQGRAHPVDVLYLNTPCRDYIRSAVDTVINIHRSEDAGDILVFLPGAEEVDTAQHILQELYQGETLFALPLYSSLPHNQQLAVFEPTPPHLRKVIFATNIAEASITIDGIRFVVDTAFVKLNYLDLASGVDALLTVPISQDMAIQRAGRAGRTAPGKCFRLMLEEDYLTLSPHSPAEMQRVDISGAVLQLKALGVHDVLHFDFLSPPSPDAMIYALELLYSLQAIDEEGRITKLGMQMAEMPVEPRLARCLIASLVDFGCSEEMLSIAAMCTVEYPFLTLRHKASLEAKSKLQKDTEHFVIAGSDHLTLLNVYQQFTESGYNSSWCDGMCLQHRILQRAKEIRLNLLSTLKRFRGHNGEVICSAVEDEKTLRKCLISGYFSHAAKLASDGKYRTLRGGVIVMPQQQSVIAQFGAPPEWVLFSEVHHHGTATVMREVTKIDPLWLHDIAPHYYDLKLGSSSSSK